MDTKDGGHTPTSGQPDQDPGADANAMSPELAAPAVGTTMPVAIYETTTDGGGNARRAELLRNAWEPVNLVLYSKPKAVFTPGEDPRPQLIEIWGYRRVIGFHHVIFQDPQPVTQGHPPTEGDGDNNCDGDPNDRNDLKDEN